MFKTRAITTVLAAFFFLASCYFPPQYPNCPMGNAHEYLSCALPEETEGNAQETDYDMFAKLLSAYCEEDASEWLPVLDRNAKKSASELRRFGRKKVSQGKIGLEEFEEVDDTDLFHASVALYVTGPALSGMFGGTEECIPAFERMAAGGLMEWIEENEQQ